MAAVQQNQLQLDWLKQVLLELNSCGSGSPCKMQLGRCLAEASSSRAHHLAGSSHLSRPHPTQLGLRHGIQIHTNTPHNNSAPGTQKLRRVAFASERDVEGGGASAPSATSPLTGAAAEPAVIDAEVVAVQSQNGHKDVVIQHSSAQLASKEEPAVALESHSNNVVVAAVQQVLQAEASDAAAAAAPQHPHAPRGMSPEPVSTGSPSSSSSSQRSLSPELEFTPGARMSPEPGSTAGGAGTGARPLFPTMTPQQVLEAVFGAPGATTRMPDYLRNLEEMSKTLPGTVTMYRPRVARQPGAADPSTLPLLLYLPGIDGTGLAAYNQFPSLAARFDLRGLYIAPSNRSTFPEIVEAAQAQLEAELAGGDPLRPVYLLGESFGALVALAIAQRSTAVDRLVLVNPATSFDESVWPSAGPLLTALPESVYNTLPVMLAPLLMNPQNMVIAPPPPPQRRSAFGLPLPSLPFPRPPAPPAEALKQLSDIAWRASELLPELGSLRSVLPPATLAHRLKLLGEGATYVSGILGKVEQRALVVVSDGDALIPSAQEGPRLKKELPRARVKVLQGRGHALLQEQGVDLAALLEEEGFYVPRRNLSSPPVKPSTGAKAGRGGSAAETAATHHQQGPAAAGVPLSGAQFGRPLPVEVPTPKEVEAAIDDGGLRLITRLASPVFYSTMMPSTDSQQHHHQGGAVDRSRIVRGLGPVPLGKPGKPVLLVGNHQLFAPDMPPMVAQFLKERGVLVRGLAHPIIFQGVAPTPEEVQKQAEEERKRGARAQGIGPLAFQRRSRRRSGARGRGMRGEDDPSFGSLLTSFGAVPVSGFAMHKLLAAGETLLLYPGGVREAFKNKGEEYRLFWPDRPEFVRMAAKFGATIVPFSAIGADDGVTQVLDSKDILGLPFIGDAMRAQQSRIPQARTGTRAPQGTDSQEAFVMPLIAPKLDGINRLYYLFGEPIETSPDLAADRAECDRVYQKVKGSVEGGLSYLQEGRKRDPYKDVLRRLAYELPAWGGAQPRQAPSFEP